MFPAPFSFWRRPVANVTTSTVTEREIFLQSRFSLANVATLSRSARRCAAAIFDSDEPSHIIDEPSHQFVI